MSFDVFVQSFAQGDASAADGRLVAEHLRPYLVETRQAVGRLRFGDGDAAILGLENLASGFMVNHASERQVWDVLVAIAQAADLAIMAGVAWMRCPDRRWSMTCPRSYGPMPS
ncbi:MAG: hypothetical protein ACRDPA_25285 [Solirubrobacteraceae bacterium]